MDGAIHAAAAEQARIGRVDNGVHVELGDIALDDLQAFLHIQKSVVRGPRTTDHGPRTNDYFFFFFMYSAIIFAGFSLKASRHPVQQT